MLHRSVHEQDSRTFDLIMEHFSHRPEVMESQDNERGWTPLLLAAINHDLPTAKQLVAGGARVLTPMEKGVTVFHVAAANNDVRLLDFAIN